MPMPAVGARVLVPLGKKVITGIVLREHTEPIAEGIALREIIEVLDVTESVVSEQQLQLWQWMADYYMCPLGEVLAAALPAGILDDNYKARTTTFVRLHEGIDPQQALRDLARAPKQQHVLEVFERVAGCSSPVSTNQSMVRPGDRTSLGASLGSSIGDALRFSPSCEKRLLIEQSGESTAIVRALVERGIFDEYEENTTRLQPFTGNIEPAHPLTAPQQKAKDEIDRYFGYKTPSNSETPSISPLKGENPKSPFKGDLEGLEGQGGSSFPTISAALSAAFADASPEDLIFIGGSNYVVGTALQSPLLSSTKTT